MNDQERLDDLIIDGLQIYQRPDTVSYTHLDVYKRQGLLLRIMKRLRILGFEVCYIRFTNYILD